MYRPHSLDLRLTPVKREMKVKRVTEITEVKKKTKKVLSGITVHKLKKNFSVSMKSTLKEINDFRIKIK